MTQPKMKTANWLLAALLALPVASYGAMVKTKACRDTAPTARSYTWNFSREATRLLNDVRDDAMKIREDGRQLDNFVKEPETIDWRAHADKLAYIKADVNDIGAKLCRLETIRSAAMPWQKKAIDRTATDDRLLAMSTTNALQFLTSHEHLTWSPTYGTYADNIVRQSTDLARFVGQSEHLAKLRREEMQARREVNRTAS